jgi:hypothetical protein
MHELAQSFCSDQEIEKEYSFMFPKYLFDYMRSLKDPKTTGNARSNIVTHFKNIRFFHF